MMLVESALALSILTVIGLMLLKISLNILQPRQWGLHQSLSDAYLSFERAYAERIPFGSRTESNGNLLDSNSPWPEFPNTASTQVMIGRLPRIGRVEPLPVPGTVTRTRIPDPGNFAIDGGSGTEATNPAGIRSWRVQSVLTYRIGGRHYIKSRTVLRSQ